MTSEQKIEDKIDPKVEEVPEKSNQNQENITDSQKDTVANILKGSEPEQPKRRSTIGGKDPISVKEMLYEQSKERPSSARNQYRNPITGEGYPEKVDRSMKAKKNKDGNPVLGTGYGNVQVKTSKVPPGGISKMDSIFSN